MICAAQFDVGPAPHDPGALPAVDLRFWEGRRGNSQNGRGNGCRRPQADGYDFRKRTSDDSAERPPKSKAKRVHNTARSVAVGWSARADDGWAVSAWDNGTC